ncbi:MAG: tetratricopeptide repeat protein [Proteobacteria bacterium]|nr:tetratricopeptide repeat protein [Pseudomonadota bacterium]
MIFPPAIKADRNGKESGAPYGSGFRWVSLLLFACLVLSSSCRRDEAQRMFDRGLVLWESQKYDEAVQNFIALTKAFPEHHLVDDSLFWIANIYEHYLKDSKQTIRFYRTLNNTFKDSTYRLQSMVGLARVRALEGDEGKRKAVRIYRKLQKKQELSLDDDEWIDNQLRLAYLFFELKQYEQARVELKRLILEMPDSKYIPKAYYQIGRSYYLEGKLDLAKIAYLEGDRKTGFKKTSLDSAISLASIYEETGQLKSAIEIYQTILNRLERKEVFYQLATDRIKKLKLRLKKTNAG